VRGAPGAMPILNFALGSKRMRAKDLPKNEPIRNGTPSTKEAAQVLQTRGKFLPNRQRTKQRAYAKLAANPEWRERHNAKMRERRDINDPAFRARGLARGRLYRARRKKAEVQRKGSS
jgi:hypothetical protein